ncbi:CYTH domain-containing protein [Candidatus Falkowbacteria bacterium]|nr:CYTH domain-containing protein [Candidatus Falkowbacteria bacterium]MBT7006974.1 CYTH domain-containing protein [Candidatus Falkowbacteria bacterium]
MMTEFEATFIDIDVDEVRKKLKSIGAKLIYPERLMTRVVFFPPKDIKGGWMRVRDEGDKITMSLKVVNGEKIEDQKEICFNIDDFDQGCQFLETIGAKRKSFQETKREMWHYDDVEIAIDTWPGLDPYVEVESDSEDKVKKVSDLLGFDFSKAIFGAADVIYELKLGILPDVINNRTPRITFDNPPQGN